MGSVKSNNNAAVELHEHAEAMLQQEGNFPGFEQLESEILKTAMKNAKGNLSAAARALNITRPQLAYRLKKLGIDPD
jgi:transcriptional regulator with GAF, ATPase, and Fis domain